MKNPSVKIGEKFNRLKIVEILEPRNGNRFYRCECECGGMWEGPAYTLKNNDARSCGCLRDELLKKSPTRFKTRHGESTVGRQSLTYLRWLSMKRRLKHNKHYKNVTICKEWSDSYEAFKADMGECPSYKHTVDRIDGTKGYWPDNCRWATKKQQASNKKNNVVVIVGNRKMTGAEWCDENGIHSKARYNFYRRFAKGLSPEESIKGLGRI